MLMKAKMRAALLLAVVLAFGLLGPTNASCDVKNGNTAVCQKLDDVININTQNLTTLKASVVEKTLRSSSLKSLPSSMKSLDLSDGEIKVIEPGTFLKMTGLSDLAMSDNSIAQLKDSALDGLDKLKNLNLRRNNIRQLPSALKNLKALKNLELSGNPLACNCATLRVRDDLLANGVKISKKVFCVTPSDLKGVSLLQPESALICMFEEQDDEMQADQAAGSGDGDGDLPELTDVPQIPDVEIPDDTETAPEIITDDLIVPSLKRTHVPTESGANADSGSDSSSSSTSSSDDDADGFEFSSGDGEGRDNLIVEGSGVSVLEEEEEEGSGAEGSGTDSFWKPEDSADFDRGEQEEHQPSSTTTEQPASSTMGWLDAFWNAFTGDDDADEENNTEQSSSEEDAVNVTPEEVTTPKATINNKGLFASGPPITDVDVVTKKVDLQDAGVSSTNNPNAAIKADNFPSQDGDDEATTDKGEASTVQTKRSMGSYVVLAALLAVLGALIGFAAYKSSFCKKKPRNDPERGTEFKDMQKSLLDSNNTNQAKISSNGGAESAPLVDQNQDTWAGPQEIRRWDHHAAPTVENGDKYAPPAVESDPVKPPRKSLPPQEDANGYQEVKTHAPMSTFTPRTNGAQGKSVTPPNSPSSVIDDGNHSPPLSPNAQRVKITLQENPDSVPKTPILITRTKPGVNLVKSS